MGVLLYMFYVLYLHYCHTLLWGTAAKKESISYIEKCQPLSTIYLSIQICPWGSTFLLIKFVPSQLVHLQGTFCLLLFHPPCLVSLSFLLSEPPLQVPFSHVFCFGHPCYHCFGTIHWSPVGHTLLDIQLFTQLKRMTIPPSKIYQQTNVQHGGIGAHESLLCPRLTFDKPSVCVCPMQTTTAVVRSCLRWLYLALKVVFHSPSSYFLALKFFLLLHLQRFLSISQGAMDVLFSSEHSTVSLSTLISYASLHSFLFTAKKEPFLIKGKSSICV